MEGRWVQRKRGRRRRRQGRRESWGSPPPPDTMEEEEEESECAFWKMVLLAAATVSAATNRRRGGGGAQSSPCSVSGKGEGGSLTGREREREKKSFFPPVLQGESALCALRLTIVRSSFVRYCLLLVQ